MNGQPARLNLYVVARFLDRLAEPGARWTRSRLQLAVRLNYDLFRAYEQALVQRGYLAWTDVDGEAIAVLTGAGREARIKLLAMLHDWAAGP